MKILLGSHLLVCVIELYLAEGMQRNAPGKNHNVLAPTRLLFSKQLQLM